MLQYNCDYCTMEYSENEIFWNHTDINNDNEYLVQHVMSQDNKDICCFMCFDDILKRANSQNIIIEY